MWLVQMEGLRRAHRSFIRDYCKVVVALQEVKAYDDVATLTVSQIKQSYGDDLKVEPLIESLSKVFNKKIESKRDFIGGFSGILDEFLDFEKSYKSDNVNRPEFVELKKLFTQAKSYSHFSDCEISTSQMIRVFEFLEKVSHQWERFEQSSDAL